MKTMLLLLLAANPTPDLDREFARDVLVVIASEFACHKIDVYLASSRSQQLQGLMFVRQLPEMTGMLFLYDRTQDLSMWMRNTLISLDIAFIDSGGDIINVARNTEPNSLRTIPAAAPAQFVLELNAGATERLSIDAGSSVLVNDLIRLRQ